ncbi:MAG TPA: pyruvate formate lyase family protein [Spirochaetota bacterium]|nr:formate acetyltransferase [Spirochaetota bacterium]HOD14078.1 pyruvate formate lyase family protein [Spirochaetota bacterium]HPG51978.1 pyruvate formate lyase family protein [Spirochaetota bacterium]HPN11477.1 pyruvate formate lyase family protein [Spirochaetota bacterium]
MQSSTSKRRETGASGRITRLRAAVQGAAPGICTERALIWTAYHRDRGNRRKHSHIRMAEALREVLLNKTAGIYPDELIVGNFTSRRVGGSIYPELHGVPVMIDLFSFNTRKTNPLEISRRDRIALMKIIPFWMFRFLGVRAYRSPFTLARFMVNQLRGHQYLINETGGISHLAPDYEKLLAVGTDGIVAEVRSLEKGAVPGTDRWHFYQGVRIIAEGLAMFGERYAELASQMAFAEQDPVRKKELLAIAAVCRRVPRKGARTLQEAVQSLFFAQIAINLESLDNSVCPGRMDRYLYPYYRDDLRTGRLTRARAKEILSAFSIKMSEIIPVFSRHLTGFHGGMFNGQVVTVGGVDARGKDATNELSYIFLEIMEELRMRQPNYHARVHAKSPRRYLDMIYEVLAAGSNSPALYNDDVIIPTLVKHGYSLADARDYTAVGCVEPVSQGKSFSSTDAALMNTALCLELALNRGRRFGSPLRTGPRTRPVSRMRSMDDVCSAFEAQLGGMTDRLIRDLQAIERANTRHHPTPLTSMLLGDCLEKGVCSTAGGARYNFSGVQNTAPIDIGDALAAIEKVVFTDRRITLPELAAILKANIPDERDRDYLRGLPKYGNDVEEADRWSVYVIRAHTDALRAAGLSTRGGRYVPGLYSVTAHEFFGRVTGALPHGRRKGEPFASGVSAVNGMDRNGPTALINSTNRIDFTEIANGVNYNLKFDSHTLRGETGRAALAALIRTFFRRGGMQAQINVVDPSVLIEARDHPDRYPNLLVRVSGYSAYFNDLTPAMKDEIIRRNCYRIG